MALPEDIVLDRGELNEKRIWKRQILYQGMNGRYVERFFLNQKESYIFKPLTNQEQVGREVWINGYVLAHLPNIYPKVLASSTHENPQVSWIIFEDLGPLFHDFNEQTICAVTKEMAWWHSLPTALFSDLPHMGLKPSIEEILAEVCAKKEQVIEDLPINETILLKMASFKFSKMKVLCHGDLHIGNYAVVDGKIKVLDWEHAHLNTLHWDLYHAIDMAHPIFPKTVTAEIREKALDCYLNHVSDKVDRTAFKTEYYVFASVFSIWMLLLIRKDLQADGGGKWATEQLERQWKETMESLKQCIRVLL